MELVLLSQLVLALAKNIVVFKKNVFQMDWKVFV